MELPRLCDMSAVNVAHPLSGGEELRRDRNTANDVLGPKAKGKK